MIGLGTYSFFWELSDRAPAPLGLLGALERSRDLGAEVFQICDHPPLERMADAELTDLAQAAADLGLAIELGTRGIASAHLSRYLELSAIFGASLVRTMLFTPDHRPDDDDARRLLESALSEYEAAGVVLALETYEQIPTARLVGLVDRVASPNLGICLDPANTVAGLELPKEVVERCARLTTNIHVKDFAFARQEGWVGFVYSGAPLGQGRHDYAHLVATVEPDRRGINQIVEHWLPWQGDAERTVRVERDWTRTALDYLRRTE